MRRKLLQRKAENEVDKYVKKVCYKDQYIFHDTHQMRLINNFTFFTTCIVIRLLKLKPTKIIHFNALIYKTPTLKTLKCVHFVCLSCNNV